MISLISDFVYSELPDITFISPMWLNKYTVDIIKIDAFFGASYRFKHRWDTEVSCLSEYAVCWAYNEFKRLFRERIVAEPYSVEFREYKCFHIIRVEPFGNDRVGNSAFNVLIDRKTRGRWLKRLISWYVIFSKPWSSFVWIFYLCSPSRLLPDVYLVRRIKDFLFPSHVTRHAF